MLQRKQTTDPLTFQFLFDAFTSSLKYFYHISVTSYNNNSPEFHKVVQRHFQAKWASL